LLRVFGLFFVAGFWFVVGVQGLLLGVDVYFEGFWFSAMHVCVRQRGVQDIAVGVF
jgi:hypothetical protein